MPPAPELLALARAAATKHALDFTFSVSSVPCTGTALVCAVVEQESAWDTHSIRYEPAFFAKYVARLYTSSKISATEAYARAMSWGLCISAGELVSTEQGWHPIESLKAGVRVLNRQGILSRARAVVQKPPAQCLEVALALNPPLRLTPNHLVFARKATLSKWHSGKTRVLYDRHSEFVAASELGEWDQVAFPRFSPTVTHEEIDATDFLKVPEGWRNAIDYRVRDGWVVVSYKGGRERCRVRKNIPINNEFLELAGLYLAEGHRLEKGKGCAFSFHAKEISLQRRVIELATKVFGDTPNHAIREGARNGVQVVLYGVGPRLLTEIIPGTATTKQIPAWMLWLPPEKQKYLFLGAFLGDGCRKYAKITTASAQLAQGMCHILLRLGIVSRLAMTRAGDRCWYDVQLNSHAAVSALNSRLGNLAEWIQTSRFGLRRRNSTQWDQDLDFVYFPVRRISAIAPRPVFDLDAGEDASFCVGRSVVHNCQVMGQVAREHGFSGKFLSALCEPDAGLDIGCAVLASKLALAHSHPLDVIPNPAPTHLVGDGGEGSAFDPGAENQQQIPRTASRAPAGAGEIQTACDSARDDTVREAGRLEGQGIALDENLIVRALQLWNGGANPDYAAQVLARLPHYR